MSLINDALKRAKQTQHRQPVPAAPVAPLRAVEVRPTPAPAGASGALWWLFAAALLGLVAATLIFTALRGGQTTVVQAASPPAKMTATPSALEMNEALPPSPTVSPPAANPVATSKAQTELVTAVAQVAPIPQAPAPSLAAAAAAPAPSTPAVNASLPTNPEITSSTLPTQPVATPVPPPSTPPVVLPPTLPKLQGIMFLPDSPSALLNGRSLLVGEQSGEFLVTAITRKSVTVVREGVTNVLRLGP